MLHRLETLYVWIETTEMSKANISVTLQIQPTGRMEPAGVAMCWQKMRAVTAEEKSSHEMHLLAQQKENAPDVLVCAMEDLAQQSVDVAFAGTVLGKKGVQRGVDVEKRNTKEQVTQILYHASTRKGKGGQSVLVTAVERDVMIDADV